MNQSYLIFSYLIIVNFITFILYAIDKWKAQHHKWRINENLLIILAFVGGSIGALLAMKIFHHKTKHKKFRIAVPIILFFQIVLTIIMY